MSDSQKTDELILLVAELTKALEKERALKIYPGPVVLYITEALEILSAIESLEKSKCNKCKVKVSPCLHYDPSDDEE